MTPTLLLLVAIKAGGVDLSPIPAESCWAWATNVGRAVASHDPGTFIELWASRYPDNALAASLAERYLQDSDVMQARNPYREAFMDCRAADRGIAI